MLYFVFENYYRCLGSVSVGFRLWTDYLGKVKNIIEIWFLANK